MLTFQDLRCFGGPYYVLRTTHIVTLHHHTLIPPCLCFCFLRFETSSHVFRSFAIVPPHASKLLRMSFAVPLLSLLCFFFLRFETSSHVFRSFAIVSSLLLFSSLRFFFASLLFFSFQAILPSHHHSIFPLPLVSHVNCR